MKRLVLIDGNSLANRAFYALPLLTNKSGIYTNSVYGFTQIMLKILSELKPDYLMVAFDAGKYSFRNEKYEDYKGKRLKTPHELSEQFPLIKSLLDSMDLHYFELDGYEADDIIGTVAKFADQHELDTIIYSGDKDLFQLISGHTTVYITRKGITEVDIYNQAKLAEEYSLEPAQIVDLKGLMGDSSDNIPGVPGVGEKTALKLLAEYKTLENVLEHADEISGAKLKENLLNNKEIAQLSKWLATINREVPMDLDLDYYQVSELDDEKVANFFTEMGFMSLLARIGLNNATSDASDASDVKSAVQVNMYPNADLAKWEKLFTDKTLIALAVNQDNLDSHKKEALSLCLFDGTESLYLTVEEARSWKQLLDYLKDATAAKYCFDSKSDEMALYRAGIEFTGATGDIMLCNYLLDPAAGTDELATIGRHYLGLNIDSEEQIFGKGAKRSQPKHQIIAKYLSNQAAAILQLLPVLEKQLEANEMLPLLYEIELPLAKVLAAMEKRGFKVDVKQLEKMSIELNRKLEQLTADIYELAGTEFNINSPKQLSDILFERLELPVIKKTKTGYSTDVEVLDKLEPYHPIISQILLYRQLGKLHSTYIDGLLRVVDPITEHVYTTFNQAITTTGRLSSTDPNLQNIPIRLEEGRKIREVFVPSNAGWKIVAADYSQIELRVLAHIANDETLIKAFLEGKDIHTSTAMEVFGLAEHEVAPNYRRQAKAVNFGIVYGISDYGLSQNLNISRKEAQDFIDRYFSIYPALKGYMQSIVVTAKKNGYVSTLAHRRRYLPDINSSNFNLRSFAERTAINTPIQGTAADIIKIAMVSIEQAIQDAGLKSSLKLQVHDELIFEVAPSELEVMRKLIVKEMESAMQLSVPLKVDVKEGKNWYEAD